MVGKVGKAGPSDWARWWLVCAAAWVAVCPPVLAERDIAADAYLDRLRGMWLGEILGNYAGRPVEGHIAGGGLSYTIDWDAILSASVWDGDDDTCFEYLYMNLLGSDPDPTAPRIGQYWADHVAPVSFYIANRQARWLMSQGYVPPDTGSVNRNVYWWSIDSQITTESIGSVAPGMRQRAADLTQRFAAVTNDGLAVHAAQFYAAMYSAAAFESNVETLVAQGLQVVPTTSRTYQVIQDVRSWYADDKADGSLDWRTTQQKICDRYYSGPESLGRYNHWVESSINTAMTTMALLYGQDETGQASFTDAVEIAACAGFDADCNPATVGGLIGLIYGFSGLPADLTAAATNDYLASSWLTNIQRSTTVTDIAAGWQAAAEAQILLAGGSITGEGSARTYHLPDDDAVTPPPGKPDPAGPSGLVGQVQAAGGTVTVSASIAKHVPARDRDNLEGIIDGVTDVTHNGHKAYSTADGANPQPAGGDFYELDFDRRVRFESVVFYEGDLSLVSANSFPTSSLGGYFEDLTVEVGSGGAFARVGGLAFSEPLDPLKFYQRILLTFDPVGGDAVRIRGRAGGDYEFTTIVELEAYGRILGPPVPGDADWDGDVDFADYQTVETHFGATAGATWAMGDFDADGDVDFADYQALETNFGTGIPEPATALLLLAGACAWRACRGRTLGGSGGWVLRTHAVREGGSSGPTEVGRVGPQDPR